MQTNKIKSSKTGKTLAKENVPANIGLTEKHAASSAMILNILLSDEHVLYIKTRNFHWNIQGMPKIILGISVMLCQYSS